MFSDQVGVNVVWKYQIYAHNFNLKQTIQEWMLPRQQDELVSAFEVTNIINLNLNLTFLVP